MFLGNVFGHRLLAVLALLFMLFGPCSGQNRIFHWMSFSQRDVTVTLLIFSRNGGRTPGWGI
jgi:hypothetical protein